LEDQKITETDVMAGNGDGIGGIARLDGGSARGRLRSCTAYGDVNFFSVFMMVMTPMDRVGDTFSNTVKTMTERVIVTIFIVVTHFA